MALTPFARGIPFALAAGALTYGFNYRLSEWGAEYSKALQSKEQDRIRAAQLRRHNYLLTAGTVGLISSMGFRRCLFPFLTQKPVGAMAVGLGVAWGGALTIASAVFDEWDHYDEGWKLSITGASLLGLLAASSVV